MAASGAWEASPSDSEDRGGGTTLRGNATPQRPIVIGPLPRRRVQDHSLIPSTFVACGHILTARGLHGACARARTWLPRDGSIAIDRYERIMAALSDYEQTNGVHETQKQRNVPGRTSLCSLRKGKVS